MRNILIQIIVILFLAACSQESTTSKYQVEENAQINNNFESSLQEYLVGLINGEKEIISKYFYKDAVKHFNKYTNYEFKINEFIEEHITQSALKAKKIYEEKGVKHFYKIEREINNIIMNDYLISAFLVSDNVVLGEKSIRDTIRVLGFKKGCDIEFITISESIENILLYRFNKGDVQEILNTAFEGGYFDFLQKMNDEIFKEYEWRLEAIGKSKDDLFTYNDKLKTKMLSEGLGEIPKKIEFSSSKNRLKLTSLKGKKKFTNYSLSSETIQLPLDEMTSNFKYTIKESGLGVYYFDLYMSGNNQEVVLAYQGYEKKD